MLQARPPDPTAFRAVTEAVDAIAAGGIAIVVDDPGRENEGDFVVAADAVTADAVNFMITEGRGLLCVAASPPLLARLEIGPMTTAPRNPDTNFMVSVDLDRPGSTGISAADRAECIRRLSNPEAVASDFRRPGHVFPLEARAHGVLQRKGHTEAAVDLARLAGRSGAGAICEILNRDGTMARMPDLTLLARRHKLPLVTIEELVSYRMRTETLVRLDGEGMIPTEFGPFELRTYESLLDGTSHVALTYGDPVASEAPLVRVHSECVTGDAFGSLRCDCGMQLQLAMKRIAEAGQGAIVYLRGHEGRGVGLPNKLRAYQLQDGGADTVEANLRLGLPVDARDYSIGAHILRHLGLDRVRLMTNNPAKVVGLERCGMQVASTVPLETAPTPDNLRYLAAKRAKMGHRLNLLEADGSGVRANGAAPGKRPKVPAGGAYG